ncbi:MAG: hypothetical protein JO189_10955 [Deltaproteobacteria bacterium]|nr:hypothetical protein [Deltaproteobacteria bacterium]
MSLPNAVDGVRNRAANGHELKFSAYDSLIQLDVIPLDEELYMARAAATLLAQLSTIIPAWKN